MNRSIYLRRTSKIQDAFANTDTLYTVMTRFNVRRDDPRMAVHQRSRAAHDRWFEGRAEVFRRYCLPAMTQQSIAPHAWFILFDKQISKRVSALLTEILEYDWIVPLILGDDWGKTKAPQMREVAARRFAKQGYAFSCTVRLDSDDSLNCRFMEFCDRSITTLRRQFELDESHTINFPYGAVHLGDSYYVNHQERQFFGIFEPIEMMNTPYRTGHRQIGKVTDVYDVFTPQPMFIYHAHETNISEVAKLDPQAYQPFGDIPGLLRQFGLEDLAR